VFLVAALELLNETKATPQEQPMKDSTFLLKR
jgi:hypothetical protein